MSFSERFEWKAHCFIHRTTLATCFVALVLKSFNSLRGGVCYATRSPTFCWLEEYQATVGECTRGLFSLRITLLVLCVELICMLSSIVILCKLYLRVRNTDRMYRQSEGHNSTTTMRTQNDNNNNDSEAPTMSTNNSQVGVASNVTSNDNNPVKVIIFLMIIFDNFFFMTVFQSFKHLFMN